VFAVCMLGCFEFCFHCGSFPLPPPFHGQDSNLPAALADPSQPLACYTANPSCDHWYHPVIHPEGVCKVSEYLLGGNPPKLVVSHDTRRWPCRE
jgi:hypothetical protein